jgi:hypothetical protein
MSQQMMHSTHSSSLADILEKVLDKGVVIAGDIQIKIADVELLTIKIRLLICSVDKAMEMGINWWQTDTFLSPKAEEALKEKKIADLEMEVAKLKAEV